MKSYMSVLIFWIILIQVPFFSTAKAQREEPALKSGWESNLQNLLRNHGLLLNEVIVTAYNNKPQNDIEALKRKLHNNAHALAVFFGVIQGQQAGSEFERLFDDHIKWGGEYINASKQHLPTDAIAKKALQNGRQIADLFSTWFPSIPKQEWQKMLEEHVNLEAQQADAYFADNMNKGLALKNESLVELRQLGNLLIKGIQKQQNQ